MLDLIRNLVQAGTRRPVLLHVFGLALSATTIGLAWNDIQNCRDVEQEHIQRTNQLQVQLVKSEEIRFENRKQTELLESAVQDARRQEKTNSKPKEAEVINLLSKLADSQDLKVVAFDRKSIRDFEMFSELCFRMELEGSYFSVCRLLESMNQLSHHWRVSNLKISNSNDSPQQKIVLEFSIVFNLRATEPDLPVHNRT